MVLKWIVPTCYTQCANRRRSSDGGRRTWQGRRTTKAQDRARLQPTELRALGLKIGEACFFFDRPTQMFLKEVWTVSDRILFTRDQRELMNAVTDEARWLALGKQLSAD